MKPGSIIILNGASSSGKTSIVRQLQATIGEPFLDAGLDWFLWMLPSRFLERPLWDDVLGLATEAGETGHRLVLGMHRAIAELARAGNNVITDHVLVEPAWVADCAAVLADLPAWLVGIRCPLEVLEAREQARGDRTLGQARAQYELVHQHVLYDIEVNTAEMTPGECAEYIWAAVENGTPTALKRLRPLEPASSRTHH
jgi:chloramphenicol 3-O phosphotransferase